MVKVNDKRVVKTKNLIKTTVANLLKFKNVEEITVTDVSSCALIQRATFYNHYSNIYDVLLDVEHDIITKFKESLAPVDFTNLKASAEPFFERVSESLDTLDPNYKDLIESQDPFIIDGISRWFGNETIKFVETHQHLLSELERIALDMYVKGLIDAYVKWRKNHDDEQKSEFIAYATRVVESMCDLLNLQ